MISLKSCIWSKVEKYTLLKAFIHGIDSSGILPKNSGKSIIYQIELLLREDMDRDRHVCDGGAEIGLFLMLVSNQSTEHGSNSTAAPGQLRD